MKYPEEVKQVETDRLLRKAEDKKKKESKPEKDTPTHEFYTRNKL